jgi:hypothetical protein
MATAKHTIKSRSLTSLVTEDADLMKVLVKEAVQAFLEERWIHALERTVRTTDADLDATQDITNIT